MKKIYLTLIIALLAQSAAYAQGWPANYGGVMLQGFFWDSYKQTPDCSPFGPWANHQNNEATANHHPGYTWATMYGAGWTSGEEWQVPVTTWASLLAHKDEITPFIDLLWLPQSGSTVADSTMVYYKSTDDSPRQGVRPWRNGANWEYDKYGGGEVITNPDCMGFVPVFYFHHGLSFNPDGTPWTYTDKNGHVWTPMSYFGTEAELRELIDTLKTEGTGAIEDVVANHRGGLGTWSGDKNSIEFPTEYYKGTFSPEGEYISWDKYDVCSDDESGQGAGNPDCGGRGQWARDIDHHSPATRAKVLKFLDFLKNDLGYVGFRYDYAMGFEEKHFAEYNTTLRPTFSVGEYWGSIGDISNWIHKTYMEGTYQSAAFDFPLQSAIREAFNYGNYRGLNDVGLISDPVLKRYAVTFLDNHDTFKDLPTDGSNYNWSNGKAYQHRVEKNIVEANAFILAMPGTPCMFYPHFMHPTWGPTLRWLIKARRTAGITNESERSAAVLKGNNGIQWIITGNNGQVCFQLGDATDDGAPEGFTTVWESDAVDGKRVARYSITSSLYDQIEGNTKKNLINGYPVIDRNSCTFSGSMTVNVKPSTEGCVLVYTTDGTLPNVSSQQITAETALNISETTTLKVGVLVDGTVPTSSVVTREYVKTATVSDKINFYVKDDNAPYIYTYYYDNDGNKHEPFGGWHGYYTNDFPQVQVGGLNWWHVQMDKPEYPVSLIINWAGSQTPDIEGITSDVFYTVQDGQPNDVTNIYMPMMENPGLTIDKPTGSYEGEVSPKITSSYSGATIVYTTDGTEPTANSEIIASGTVLTFNETGNHYLRAGILKDGEVINQVARSYYVTNGHGSGVNIFVKNMTTNDAPHIHAWDGNGTAITSPGFDDGGETLTETVTNCGQTWYKRHFDQVPSGMLFMLSGHKDKSANITYLQDGNDYYFYYYPGAHFGDSNFQPGYIDVTADSKHTTTTKAITIFMYDNGNDWSNGLKLYPYANNSQIFWGFGNSWVESSFPTTTIGGQSWFYCTFLNKDNIGAILFNGNSNNERLELTNITSDVFMKFPRSGVFEGSQWYDWSTGENLTEDYKNSLPAVETPQEDSATPQEEAVIPSCAVEMSDCQYFYFENDSFGSPYAWVYSGTKKFGEHGWPGEALIEVVGTAPSGNLVYRWTYNSDQAPTDIIFSNNGQSQAPAEKSFPFVNGGYYTTSGLQGMAHDNIKPLADVINGELNKTYTISNEDVVAVYTDQKGYQRIFIKDAEATNPSVNTNNKPVHPSMDGWNYDQGNWLEIVLPAPLEGSGSVGMFDKKNLLDQTIVGKLTNKENPTLEVVAYPIPDKEASFTPNQYLTANFMDASVNPDYFLVTPQPQEYAVIQWAVYHDGKFYMPKRTNISEQGELNTLHGAVSVSGDNSYFDFDKQAGEFQEFQDLQMYELTVIVKKKSTTTSPHPMNVDVPVNDDPVSGSYEIAIVKATKLSDDVVTTIDNVVGKKDVVRTIYFNLAGVESDRPFEGVNIVVTEYTDGSHSASKVIR